MLDILPPWQGGGNMIKDVTIEETQFNAPPARFEAGTPNVADAIGLGAALDYVSRIGMHNIERHEHDLTEYAREQLGRIKGLTLIGNPKQRVSVVSFELEGIPTPEVGHLLDKEGIAVRAGHHCAQSALRALGYEMSVRPSFILTVPYCDVTSPASVFLVQRLPLVLRIVCELEILKEKG